MANIPSLDLIYRSPSLRAWVLEDHLVVTKFPEPEIHIWNPTATVLWLLLVESKKTLEELVFQVTTVFDNCSSNIHAELATCLKDWSDKKWLKLDEKGNYFISPEILESIPGTIETNPPNSSRVVVDKSYCINEHVFRLIIRTCEESNTHLFLSRLIAITKGFLDAKSNSSLQLEVVIDSDVIYLRENAEGFRKWQNQAEALSHCIQYFLKVSAGESKHFLTLHAAAIGQENCILLSGVSGAGKSTLCALLTLQGWDYFGDDLVGLTVDANANGQLVPLPSAISIKSNNWEFISGHYLKLSTLDIVRYGGKLTRYLPLPHSDKVWNKKKLIKGIIFPRYSNNIETAYQSISVIDALNELVNAGLSLHKEMSLDEVESFFNFLCHSPLYRLEYSDINEVNTWLSTLVKN